MHIFLSNSSLVLNSHLVIFARIEHESLQREEFLTFNSRVSPFHHVISPFSHDESKTVLNQKARVSQTAPWVSSHCLGKLGILVLQKVCFWFPPVPSMPKWNIESQPWPISVFCIRYLVVVCKPIAFGVIINDFSLVNEIDKLKSWRHQIHRGYWPQCN